MANNTASDMYSEIRRQFSLPEHEQFISPKQCAELFGVSERTIRRLRKLGSGPAYAKISRAKILYPVADLVTWIEAQMIVNGKEYTHA